MWLIRMLVLQALLPNADALSMIDQGTLRRQRRDAAITVVDSAWAGAWKLRWRDREAFLVSNRSLRRDQRIERGGVPDVHQATV